MVSQRLCEHLDHDARRVLHATAEAAARDGRSSITIELFLLSLLRERDVGPAVMKALDEAGADAPAIESALAARVAKESRSPSGALPSFDESLAHLLREAWSLAFDEYGEAAVTPVRFFETVAPLAAHHSVEFGENVLDSAVRLSRRYMVGRQLPDKAIVVLDSACAQARMREVGAPPEAAAARETPGDAANAQGKTR